MLGSRLSYNDLFHTLKKNNKDEEAPSAHKYFNGGEKQKHGMIDNFPCK